MSFDLLIVAPLRCWVCWVRPSIVIRRRSRDINFDTETVEYDMDGFTAVAKIYQPGHAENDEATDYNGDND